MSKYKLDGVIKAALVPSPLADRDAPSLAAIEAGIPVTAFMRALDTAAEGSTIDVATAESDYNATIAGNWGGQPLTGEFTCDSEYANDDAWKAFLRGAFYDLVVLWRPGGGTEGALAEGDRVDVWPVQVTTRRRMAYARNEAARFSVQLAVPEPPHEDVVVAA